MGWFERYKNGNCDSALKIILILTWPHFIAKRKEKPL